MSNDILKLYYKHKNYKYNKITIPKYKIRNNLNKLLYYTTQFIETIYPNP